MITMKVTTLIVVVSIYMTLTGKDQCFFIHLKTCISSYYQVIGKRFSGGKEVGLGFDVTPREAGRGWFKQLNSVWVNMMHTVQHEGQLSRLELWTDTKDYHQDLYIYVMTHRQDIHLCSFEVKDRMVVRDLQEGYNDVRYNHSPLAHTVCNILYLSYQFLMVLMFNLKYVDVRCNHWPYPTTFSHNILNLTYQFLSFKTELNW